MSGAGRSEAAHVLEDLGFFVIDNLPPMLIGKVAELARGHDTPTRYALVVDVRSGDFLHDLSAAIDELHQQGVTTRMLYLDAGDDVLVRRYEESRRRHPLSDSDRVSDGIARERALLEPLVARGRPARRHVDTQRARAARPLARAVLGARVATATLQVNVVSFGYKHGLPLDVDLVFDCRFLPNPHWVDELRPLTGLDAPDPRLRARAARHARVPRRARPPASGCCCPATNARARRTCRSRSAAPAAATAAS